MTSKPTLRLALRVEGDWWVAYVAEPTTMDGAFEIGRILMGAVQVPERKQGFMDLMQATMTDAIRKQFGVEVNHFEVQAAPAHEKAGRA